MSPFDPNRVPSKEERELYARLEEYADGHDLVGRQQQALGAIGNMVRRVDAGSDPFAALAETVRELEASATPERCCEPKDAIYGHWLVEVHDHCTCGDGQYAHEPGCGTTPVVDLAGLDGWESLKKEIVQNWSPEGMTKAVSYEMKGEQIFQEGVRYEESLPENAEAVEAVRTVIQANPDVTFRRIIEFSEGVDL